MQSTTRPGQRCSIPSFREGHFSSPSDVALLHGLSAPHVDGFDFFLDCGLPRAIADIEPAEIELFSPQNSTDISKKEGNKLKIWVDGVKVSPPLKSGQSSNNTNSIRRCSPQLSSDFSALTPRECRELGLSYSGSVMGEFCYQVIQFGSDKLETPGKVVRIKKKFGDMPIMVMSKACHLRGKKPKDLIHMKEEQNEFGGYFIINGIERCVRLLQIPRRNHPTAIQRSNFKNRGPAFSDTGVSIRCCRHCGDQTSVTNTVHYLTTGGVSFRFSARKQEFLIPIIILLRALSGNPGDRGGEPSETPATQLSDEEIYRRIMHGAQSNTFLRARAQLLLQDASRFNSLNTSEECLAYLGARFRAMSMRADSTSDVDIGHYMIQRYVLIHVSDYNDKLESCFLLLRKLYSFAARDCSVDNSDSLQNQEILLPGHLLTSFVKEKFEEMLISIRSGLLKEMQSDYGKLAASLNDGNFWNRTIERYGNLGSGGIGKKVQVFLSTGNIVSSTGLDLMQVSGYTIVAERLNFLRYCAHFRSVHRGQFFMEMKTTSVRKLLPDQWGFLCPVHTPDGGPCGLLSHLSLKCSVLADSSLAPSSGASLDNVLISMGVSPACRNAEGGKGGSSPTCMHLPVCVDGRVIGGLPVRLLTSVSSRLRQLKVDGSKSVPSTLEIVCISPGGNSGPYPGLYLFADAARVIRPVLHRASGRVELIGAMEQPFMDIACLPEDVREGTTAHQELDPTNMLSLIASLTPFSDYNQSPRNMYQCQMGKQTMGTPCHSLPHRSDNKLYRLQNPQAPVVQTARHGEYKMDEYPNGTNAVVAVLSYTGFDMEDAMILNKSSYERGFGHASVYKTVQIDLQEENEKSGTSRKGGKGRIVFGNKKNESSRKTKMSRYEDRTSGSEGECPSLDEDGLPFVGMKINEGGAMYSVVDSLSGASRIGKHKEKEPAYIQAVRRLGTQTVSTGPQQGYDKASITLRFNRNPVIGDKFSSRHGQKGVMSILWPQHNMPFSESGISPDIIINPHAFPSRMTIGMLIESMAGKSGALHGHFQESTPFSFHDSGDKNAIDHFGAQLQAAGFSYYGSEPLYSGVSGCQMHADLYIGVVFYQRLRHMVSDKYQVRSTGQVNSLTRQPVKGRKQGGGIRLGEMERDSLLSHGASFLLHDRLLNCSDKHIGAVTGQDLLNKNEASDNGMSDVVVMPYVFRYLTNELAAMGIKLEMRKKGKD